MFKFISSKCRSDQRNFWNILYAGQSVNNSIKSGTAAGKAVAAVTVMHVDKKAATHPAKMEVYSV